MIKLIIELDGTLEECEDAMQRIAQMPVVRELHLEKLPTLSIL